MGMPGDVVTIPEGLARALVARGHAVYVDDAIEDSESEKPAKPGKPAKKAKKPASGE